MIPADLVPDAALRLLPWRTVRVGVTGLARAGKTAFLTSAAANLLALGAGRPVLPKLAGKITSVTPAPAGASSVPRFDTRAHLAALAADPPTWPARTDSASLLALDLVIPRRGFGAMLPPQRVRLELLDYPGEWLLDLPLLRQNFTTWSETTLRRLEGRAEAAGFLSFVTALPAKAGADEALAATGHRLYVEALHAMRDAHLALLQPGRFLMPAPGPAPAWTPFFPHPGAGGLNDLLTRRYDAYVAAIIRDLSDPLFGQLDRILVLVDLLTALAAGPAAFQDTSAALAEAAGALRWRRSWLETAGALARLQAPPPTVGRAVFAATKADHVGARQRPNLAALLRHVAEPVAPLRTACFAMAAVACTTDDVMTLDGRAVSAVRGHEVGRSTAAKSYPGEVPSTPPDAAFWAHPFYEIPKFQPVRLLEAGRAGVRHIDLDSVLLALLEDVL